MRSRTTRIVARGRDWRIASVTRELGSRKTQGKGTSRTIVDQEVRETNTMGRVLRLIQWLLGIVAYVQGSALPSLSSPSFLQGGETGPYRRFSAKMKYFVAVI